MEKTTLEKTYEFKVEEFFPLEMYHSIVELRVNKPQIVINEAQKRKRRELLTRDGKLAILAADHPGRMVLAAADEPLIMGDRYQLLGRILRVLISDDFDGVMATPDIIEELFLINYLLKEKGKKSILDYKIILGCMNRGGLKGTVFELDDAMTAFTAERIKQMNLDGAKMMFRLNPGYHSSAKTILYCVEAINQCHQLGIPVFLEPLAVEGEEKGYKNIKKDEDLIKVINVATALGETTTNLWLKIPYADNFARIARATTCPILMLGGESKGDPIPVLRDFYKGMKAGPNVRGVLVGRNVTFPGKEDPLAVATAVSNIVHKDLTFDEILESINHNRGKNMGYFKVRL